MAGGGEPKGTRSDEAGAPRADLPRGTVTLMFTDIAGSTALLRDLGDRYPDVLADHRRVIRAALRRHAGVEVDTQGDAFFAAFARASDAVTAAIAIQAALDASVPARVRIGIHTGEPAGTPEGYVGMDVHRAARIAAAGHGGQVLISAQTRELIAKGGVRDLGLHRLKDVGEVRLFQVGEARFPPVRSIGSTNLLPLPGALFGRAGERAELRAWIVDERVRLITVTGIGGIGKTTLVRAIAGDLAESFPDGIWFVDLAPVTDPDLIEPALSAAVGNPPNVDEFLRSRRALVILDNFERVLHGADSVARWLESSPSLVVLVTSRERLRLQAEREYPLSPLDDAAAIALFEERARSVTPRFVASRDEVQALCRRLDGLPLALELAAARVKTLTPSQLLARLDRRLPLLTGGSRDLPERQRTLAAAIAWSCDLLDPAELELFARLAVFAGGWMLEAAEEVCGADLDRLQALVEKSLVRFEGGRFSMLGTIREYGLTRLAEVQNAGALHRRHAEYFAEVTTRADPQLTGEAQERWLGILSAEYENCRSAMRWSLGDMGSPRTGLRLSAGLVFFWYLRSLHQEGLAWLERMLGATPDDDSPERVRALWGAGFFLSLFDDERAAGYLASGIEKARAIGDRSMVARYLDVIGLHAFLRDEVGRAREMLEESIRLARAVDDDYCLADALGTVGSIYPLVGEIERGRNASREGLDIATGRRDLQCTRMALFGAALTERRAGDLGTARALAREGLEICRRLDDAFFSSYFLWILAVAERELGDRKAAREAAEEALAQARDVGASLLIVCALEARAAVAVDDMEAARARADLEEAAELGRRGGVPASYVSEALRALGELDAAEGHLDRGRRRLDEARALARRVADPWAEQRAATALERLPSP
jgi:predicted ATPase/class 3 adenylate cyclase